MLSLLLLLLLLLLFLLFRSWRSRAGYFSSPRCSMASHHPYCKERKHKSGGSVQENVSDVITETLGAVKSVVEAKGEYGHGPVRFVRIWQ